ncbi:hypothetical protein BD626DRAFT_484197 [Schizophyllum amplum]|uniref:Uncharacterized protein n=1 Tax=Schizophyllum amplum TaxID=97359 RepID=A0A550CQ35_9AGAR|nr:hypothetical protein BD626DRAFT_484197 [Auriculariopsis ampla]
MDDDWMAGSWDVVCVSVLDDCPAGSRASHPTSTGSCSVSGPTPTDTHRAPTGVLAVTPVCVLDIASVCTLDVACVTATCAVFDAVGGSACTPPSAVAGSACTPLVEVVGCACTPFVAVVGRACTALLFATGTTCAPTSISVRFGSHACTPTSTR